MKDSSDPSTQKKKTEVMNIFAMMFADGKVRPEEVELSLNIASRLGVSEEELLSFLKDPNCIGSRCTWDKHERFLQLLNVIHMMIVDGEIATSEMELCTIIAERLGFTPAIIPLLCNRLVECIDQGNNMDDIANELEHLVH